MARHKSPAAVWIEYVPLRGLFFALQLLPFTFSRRVCRLLVRAVLALLRKRHALIRQQLALSFPDASPAKIEKIAVGTAHMLGDGLAAFVKISTLTTAAMEEWVELEGAEHIEAAYRAGKGMITFTAHMGCWEMMANYVTRHHPRIAMVVRPLDNPKLDQLITSVRGSGGGGVIDSHKVFRDGLRLLRANGILGVLIDQNFYKGGVFVDFFGRLAATNTLVPILAHRTGCAVLPMHNVWKNGKIRIVCEGPVKLSDHEEVTEAVAADTLTLTKIVEGWVRENPDQWLWVHNRWKRRPAPGDSVYSEKEGLRIIS